MLLKLSQYKVTSEKYAILFLTVICVSYFGNLFEYLFMESFMKQNMGCLNRCGTYVIANN